MADPAMGVAGASNFDPIHIECDVEDLRINGALPRELNGSLIRNGPNPQFDAPGAHWFVGDGMLHSFTLAEGRASYRNRWIRTPKFLAEHDAGRAIFSGFGGRRLPDAPPTPVTDTGVANTNIVWHGGRLLALEEAHLPTEIDRRTLATLGYQDFGGGLPGAFTAHPKVDPVTGEMIFFGYNATGPFSVGMTCGTLDAGGVVTRLERFEAPFASMVHDFIVTDRHILFPILPLTGSMERARAGRPPFAWEPEKGSHIGVMKRDGSASDMVWFRGEAAYVFHVMNAWEEGDLIMADVMQTEEAPLFPHADGSAPDPAKARARLCRWTFDMSGRADRFTSRYLDDLDGEFPRIDDRRAGLAHRHGWIACANPDFERIGMFGAVAHFDRVAGRRTVHALPVGDATSEPVFVPRGPDAAEGDGWLLSVIWRAAENRSDLAVFEATDIGSRPIATVELGHRVPFGFHGNWVPAT